MKLRGFVILVLMFVCSRAWSSFVPFVIEDIRIEGLQRITLGTAFNYLPIKVGDTLTSEKSTDAIRSFFTTGFFEDVRFARDNNILLIFVIERPSIAKINISGNEDINTEELTEALKQVELAEGRIFVRSLLDQMQQELNRQYFNLGKYGVKIETIINELPQNRVEVEINIDEGEAARIRKISILGADSFEEQDLLDKIELSMPTMFSFMSGSDKYSKQQLMGDLETLRSYYLDRGYINFAIDSTHVSISPDKRDVFISVKVNEGDQYHVKDIDLSGDLAVEEDEIRKYIKFNSGDVFSRRKIVSATTSINNRLGIDGYAFANVNAIPKVDDEKKLISITFFVDPGKRVYVRRINITGNTKTKDTVIRRELRQMEGGWISTPLIERSKIRLQRLGFFENVTVETRAVPGTTDQVDVDFSVQEGSTGNFTAGLGYGQEGGFLFNTSVTLNNFLGTGKRVSLEVNNSKINNIYSFSYRDPYYTSNGVSRSFSVFSRETDAEEANLADYNTNSFGARVNYGFPMSEYTTLRWGLGFEETDLQINTANAPVSFGSWVADNGNQYQTLSTNMSFAFDTRDRAIFPDNGWLSQISAEIALPGSDINLSGLPEDGFLSYYKLTYKQRWYKRLSDAFTLHISGEYSYGDGFGSTNTLPFFENYYAGGTRSIRGFKGNTVGPRDELCSTQIDSGTGASSETCVPGEPVGGNRKVIGKIEMFFPTLFTEEPSRKFRISAFLDAGRVYGSGVKVISDNDLRTSYGLSAVWITPVGALTFNFARPLKSKADDETEFFGFNIGAPF